MTTTDTTRGARFRIGPNVYPVATVDRLTLRDLLLLERQTEEFGKPMTWSEMQGIIRTVQEALVEAKTEREVVELDDFPWFLGILVWTARRDAGEQITFGDAVDFPMGEFEFIRPVDPRKARPVKKRPRKGSGRADARAKAAAVQAAKSSTVKTSEPPSSDD
ncbi:hypothetical protein KMZ30_07280 [Phycicoccus sp. KQZ13P-1]|uniref:hypothetical protein n=1 Tax=Phycicoccus mangrovi TaxID=2840470 RepID=UPI001C00890F|nr:hypothetical protein [Phycicoccus mangrovi]MBT9255373.1 hypothetical protein [Phycicoccus mangrovi]